MFSQECDQNGFILVFCNNMVQTKPSEMRLYMIDSKLIFALDTDNDKRINKLLKRLAPILLWVKTGFQAFSVLGPNCFGDLRENGYNVFLDLKFHDIPNTVARDVGTMTKRGARMINMHASGGF